MVVLRLAFALVWLATACVSASENKGSIWAVLVAGSNGYDNYRHQSDVCHAYQILHRHGVPDSNIIVMMYDDIAHSPSNPKKGSIINKPGGPNVYPGVLKDYTGNTVTPQNFINVLTGNKKALHGVGSGKVLESGPNDHVFINFADHGAKGLIGFPDGLLHGKELLSALQTMHKKKMYGKLAFYMEACESGSMFAKILPSNINIYATTAANPEESSYACYWDDKVKAYLGDEYSVSWMEDIDYEEHKKNMTTETLLKQFEDVVKNVKENHPQMYGNKNLKKDHVVDFLGSSKARSYPGQENSQSQLRMPNQDAVSARDVPIHTLRNQIHSAKLLGKKKALTRELAKQIKGRKEVDKLFDSILNGVTSSEELKAQLESIHVDYTLDIADCYQTVVDGFSEQCVNIPKNTYVMAHLYKLAGVCTSQVASPEDVLKVYAQVCNDNHRQLTGVN